MNTTQWLKSLKKSFTRNTATRSQRRGTRRKQSLAHIPSEVLESRLLLAGADCLGQIEGITYQDLNGNGVADAGDPRLSFVTDGAVVHLFEAGVNGVFDSAGTGGVAGGDDTFIATANPDVNGAYTFPGLAEGTYFVEQPTPGGFIQRTGEDVVGPISISAVDAQGQAGQLIDDFTDPAGSQSVSATMGSPASSVSPSAAIGGERDLFAEQAGPNTASTVVMRANQIPGFAEFVSAFNTTGRGTATWDGADGDATAIDFSGLSLNLSSAGGILTEVGASNGVTTMNITLYTDATNFSTATTVLPNTGAASTVPVFLDFGVDFAIAGGTGVDLSNIGAIELEINATAQPTTSVVAGVVQALNPTVFNVNTNFANMQPMTLSGTVFNDLNNNGTFESGTESTISSVAVTLFEDEGNGVFDGTETQIATGSTVAGDYSFTNLFPGDYIVRVDASNFAAAGALEGLQSSTGNGVAPDPDAGPNLDNDDNGDHIGGVTTDAVVSQAITLVNNDEPSGADNNTNSTLDFGAFGTVDIVVLKADNADPITAGSGAGNLVYTVTARNDGPLDATGVTVTDALIANLPTGFTLVSAVGSGTTTFDAGTGVWTIGNLDTITPETLTVTLTVGASAAAGTITNTATVTTVNESESLTNNNTANEDTTIVRSVDVEVLKSDNVDPVTPGSGAGNLVYTVTAQNNGPSDATGVEVTDAFITGLPAGFTLVSAVGSNGTTFDSNTGVWDIGALANTDMETLTITITVDDTAANGTVNNIATVSAVNEADRDLTNNTANEPTAIARAVDIGVTKSDNVDPVIAGSGDGNLVYVVTATNSGPSNATGVAVTDAFIAALPTGFSLVSAVGSGTTTFDSNTGIWTIGDLDGTNPETLTVTLTVDETAAAGTVTNTATVTAVNEADGNPNNDTADEDTTVNRQVDIFVSKGDNVDPVTAGGGAGNLVYTVTALNNGPSNATGVAITDALIASLPAGFSLVSAVGSGTTTFDSNTGIWTIGDLSITDTETLTVTLTVGASAASGTITNTAVVSATNEFDTNIPNNTANEDTTVVRVADIGVSKIDNVDPVTAGGGAGNLVYTVTANNVGPSDATGVAVTDALLANLPTGFTLDSAVGSNGTTFDSNTGIWTIGNLAVTDSETLTVTLTVGTSAASGTITNTAAVSALNETDNNANNDVATEDTTVVQSVDIIVLKSDNVDPVTAGGPTGSLVYTVTAMNDGPSDATGVEITDALIASLPTGFSLVSAVGSGSTTFDSNTGVWTIGNLNNTDMETLTVTLTVGASAASGTITNTAAVTALDQTDSAPGNNTATEDTTVVRSVDIYVTKSDNIDPVTAGSGPGNLVYTVTASNNGPSNASGVTLSDALIAGLPAGFSLVSAIGSNSTTFDSVSGIWTIGSLPNGESETLTVTLTVGASAAAGTIVNTAQVSTVNETDRDLTNNIANEDTTVVRSVDIEVIKDDNGDPVTAGGGAGNLTYTVIARNNGPSNATGVAVTDAFLTALPTGFSLVSAAGTNGTTFNGGTGIWNIGNLNTGDSETLTATITVGANAAPGIVTNTATVSAVNETDRDLTNNTDDEDTTIVRAVDIDLMKVDNADPVTAGSGDGNLVYTVTATNNGPSNASGVAVTDALIASLPTGFSLESAVGSGGTTFNSTTGVWNIGNLNRSESRSLTVTLTAGAAAASGTINNVATVSAVNETDTDPGNDTAAEDTTINRVVDIAVSKSDNIDPVTAGSAPGSLVYTVTAANIGPSNASGVAITDALIASLPTGFSLVSANGTGGTTFNSTTGVWNIGNLNRGDSRILTVTLTVGVTAPSGTINNVATVTAVNETDSNPGNNTATEDTTVVRQVDVGVTKADSADPIVAGSGTGNLTYTLITTNSGPSEATGVAVTDALLTNLPAGIVIESVTGTGGSTYNSSNGVWSIGSLAVGSSRELTVVLTVGPNVTATSLTNVATVTNVNEVDINPNNDSDTEVTTIAREVDLVVSKNDLFDPIRSPGIIEYEIIVANNGPSTATNVTLTDVLSTLVTFGSVSSSQGTSTNAGGVVITDLGTIESGSEATISLIVNADIPAGATVNNIGTAVATETETNPDNNMDSASTVVLPGFSAISGFVFEDLNNNGLQEQGEPAIPDTPVILFGEDNEGNRVTRRLLTDAAGFYNFTELSPGSYSVIEIQPGIFTDGLDRNGSGFAADAENDAFLNIALGPQQQAAAVNFGEGIEDESKRDFLASNQSLGEVISPSRPLAVTGTGSVSGSVAVDRNGNGILDAADTGIPGAVVSLVGTDTAGNPVVITQTTEADGTYLFSQLPAGNYSLIETQPGGYFDGPEQQGSIMVDAVLDDLFSDFALPNGGSASGFNFLESLTNGGAVAGNQAPVLAGVNAQGTSQPTLAWAPVDNATTYDVWLNKVGEGLVWRDQDVSGTSVQVPIDLSEGTHKFWVRSIASDGTRGPWNSPQLIDVNPAPRLLTPTGSTVDSTPRFDFTDIEGAEAYDLMIYDRAGNEVVNLEGLTSSEYDSTAQLPVGDYRAWMRTRTAGRTGVWSEGNEFSITGAPDLIDPISASTLAPTLLEWNDTGADKYEIWINESSGGSVRLVVNEVVDGTAYLLDQSEPGGTYAFWVRGISDDGQTTGWSSSQRFERSAKGQVLSPSGNASSSSPTITWKPVAGATHYDVWVSDSNGVFAREQLATGTEHTFSQSFPDGAYRVWVMPIGLNGNGSWSSVSRFTVGGLERPVLVSSTASTTDRTPTIQWNAITGATSYELWVNHEGVTNKVIHEIALTSNTFTPSANLAAGNYRFWVRAIGSNGILSAWSSALELTIT